MKIIILYVSIILAAGLLFVNLYNSLIDARSWGSAIPQSLETTRAYFRTVNPGNFFRVFSPINQLIALTCLVAFWKAPAHTRWWLGAAFVLYVAADIFTFAYFYPRNDIMFKFAMTDPGKVKAAWSQWSAMNWLRSGIVAAGVLCSSLALDRIYTTR